MPTHVYYSHIPAKRPLSQAHTLLLEGEKRIHMDQFICIVDVGVGIRPYLICIRHNTVSLSACDDYCLNWHGKLFKSWMRLTAGLGPSNSFSILIQQNLRSLNICNSNTIPNFTSPTEGRSKEM